VNVDAIDERHPEWLLRNALWEKSAIMYEGGQRLFESSDMFLRKKPKELSDVFVIRKQNLSYTNLLDQIVGWFIAALWKVPPTFAKNAPRLAVKPGEPPRVPAPVDEFCARWEGNCDAAGGGLIEFWEEVSRYLLLYRKAYVLTDLPFSGDAPVTLKEQIDRGLLDPYLVLYAPVDVINWSVDVYGNLLHAVIYKRRRVAEFLAKPVDVEQWLYFDRKVCALYEREIKENEQVRPGNAVAKLVDGYPRAHAKSKMGKVPIDVVEVPMGLWLANRVYLPLLNHFNLDNALDFGLFQANLAQLVVVNGPNGEYKPTQVSEVSYHQLPAGGEMYYLEPEGKSFEHSQRRIDNLEERIYKLCYLQDQARTNSATPAVQSGISKSMDKMPGRDALASLGDRIRPAIQRCYADVLQVRGLTEVTIDVRGLDFPDEKGGDELATLVNGEALEINSQMFERQKCKRAVRLQLPDLNPEVYQAIDNEIDANPTPSKIAQQERERQRASTLQRLQDSLPKAAPPDLAA
jgi:hypothetical protein